MAEMGGSPRENAPQAKRGRVAGILRVDHGR
jgi:hypothetical protein